MDTTLTPIIQEHLQQVERLICSQVDNSSSDMATALYQLIASGGKRLRPRLVLLMGSMLGAEYQRLVTLAAAIEMLHTATLIHDDLVDGSVLRRGIATLNAHYSPIITVLLGDFTFARAAKLAAGAGSLPVMNIFAETLSIIADGELSQIGRDTSSANRAAYFHWIHAKTASMFELATGAAALLSPVDDEVVASASKFGREIGMAFQIADDVLDFVGDQNTLGKLTGSDLRQGVITLPMLCYLEAHPGYIINIKELDKLKLDQLVADIRENGAIHKAMQEADEFVQRGLEALASLPDTPQRRALAEIACSIVHRVS